MVLNFKLPGSIPWLQPGPCLSLSTNFYSVDTCPLNLPLTVSIKFSDLEQLKFRAQYYIHLCDITLALGVNEVPVLILAISSCIAKFAILYMQFK